MEDLEKRAIEDLSVVSSVCLHTGDKTHKAVVYANLRCCAASSYGGCGVKLVGTIRKSIERPTTVDYLRELGRSNGITAPPVSLQRKNCKLLKKMLLMCPQNVLLMLMRELPPSTQLRC